MGGTNGAAKFFCELCGSQIKYEERNTMALKSSDGIEINMNICKFCHEDVIDFINK